MTTTQSQAAMGEPSGRRAIRSSAMIMLRTLIPTPEVNSECRAALHDQGVVRTSGGAKRHLEPRRHREQDCEHCTTSAIPEIASSVTCQRTRTLRML